MTIISESRAKAIAAENATSTTTTTANASVISAASSAAKSATEYLSNSGILEGMSPLHTAMKNAIEKSSGGAAQLFKLDPVGKDYAASYPKNLAYTTSAGHEIEMDNSESARLRMSHRKGPTIEIHNDASSTITSPQKIQIHSANDINIQSMNFLNAIKEKFRVQATDTVLEASDKAVITAENVQMTAGDQVSITGISSSVMAADSAVVSSGASSSLTSTGMCEVSATTVMINGTASVIITSPVIQMIFGGGLMTLSPAGISSVVTAVNTISSGIINEKAGGAITTAAGGISSHAAGGVFNVKAASIILN
jgi:hypothetical protein